MASIPEIFFFDKQRRLNQHEIYNSQIVGTAHFTVPANDINSLTMSI